MEKHPWYEREFVLIVGGLALSVSLILHSGSVATGLACVGINIGTGLYALSRGAVKGAK